MNEQMLRPTNVAAGAVVIGGLLVVVLPQHALSIVRLVIVTVGAAAGLYALASNAPPTWWKSPFERTGRARLQDRQPDQLAWIRSRLSLRRQRIAQGPALPPETLRLLQPLIVVALEREGLDPGAGAGRAAAPALLSPLTWAVLTSDPADRSWRTLAPDGRAAADVVHTVLDDLDRLAAGGRDAHNAPDNRAPQAT